MKNENIENLIQKNTESREHFGAKTNRQASAATSESRSVKDLPDVSRALLQDILGYKSLPCQTLAVWHGPVT